MKALIAADSPRLLDEVERLLARFPLPNGTELTVITVVEDVYGLVRELGGETFGAASFYDDMQREAMGHAQELLDDVSGRFAGQGYALATRLLQGNPASEIVRYAEQESFDLIILGSHDLARFERAIMGSVSFHVLNQTAQEILIVRPRAAEGHADGETPAILYAEDGSTFAAEGLNFLRRLAERRSDARVTLSSVMPLITLYRMDLKAHLSESWNRKREARQGSLDRRCDAIRDMGFACESLLSEHESVGKALISQAESLRTDLVLAGRCGKRGLKKLFLGSTAYRLASEAPCSVWIGAKREDSSHEEAAGEPD